MNTPNRYCIASGKTVTIRPVRTSDADMDQEFVRRLSVQTKHYRFLGGVSELTPIQIQRRVNTDGEHSMAFIATVQENGQEIEIGVSRYAPSSIATAREMAVTVADEWQNQGVGTRLTQQLIEFAKSQGIRRLYSVDLADNKPMRNLAKDLGMTAMRDPDNAHQVIYTLKL